MKYWDEKNKKLLTVDEVSSEISSDASKDAEKKEIKKSSKKKQGDAE